MGKKNLLDSRQAEIGCVTMHTSIDSSSHILLLYNYRCCSLIARFPVVLDGAR